MLHDAAHDITAFAAFPSGTGRGSGPLTSRVTEQGDQAQTDVVGVFPNPEAAGTCRPTVIALLRRGRSGPSRSFPSFPGQRLGPRILDDRQLSGAQLGDLGPCSRKRAVSRRCCAAAATSAAVCQVPRRIEIMRAG